MLIENATCDVKNCVFNVRVDSEKVWSLTSSPGDRLAACSPEFQLFSTSEAVIRAPNNKDKLYLCVRKDNQWFHQGNELFLSPDDVGFQNFLR